MKPQNKPESERNIRNFEVFVLGGKGGEGVKMWTWVRDSDVIRVAKMDFFPFFATTVIFSHL